MAKEPYRAGLQDRAPGTVSSPPHPARLTRSPSVHFQGKVEGQGEKPRGDTRLTEHPGQKRTGSCPRQGPSADRHGQRTEGPATSFPTEAHRVPFLGPCACRGPSEVTARVPPAQPHPHRPPRRRFTVTRSRRAPGSTGTQGTPARPRSRAALPRPAAPGFVTDAAGSAAGDEPGASTSEATPVLLFVF